MASYTRHDASAFESFFMVLTGLLSGLCLGWVILEAADTVSSNVATSLALNVRRCLPWCTIDADIRDRHREASSHTQVGRRTFLDGLLLLTMEAYTRLHFCIRSVA
jgi:hypothetical protein